MARLAHNFPIALLHYRQNIYNKYKTIKGVG